MALVRCWALYVRGARAAWNGFSAIRSGLRPVRTEYWEVEQFKAPDDTMHTRTADNRAYRFGAGLQLRQRPCQLAPPS
eukprot:gene16708-biopygen15841